jgi:hypothetical protein
LRTLAVLWAIVGVFFLIPSALLMSLGSFARMLLPVHLGLAREIGPFAAVLVGGSLMLVGAGGLLVGWGLSRREHWARGAAIVLGILALFHPPLGLALGIYTLWVLLPAESGAEYQRMTGMS